VPLAVFRMRNLSLANLLGALTFALGSLFAFVLTLYLQNVLGLSALFTGLVFLPAGIGGMLGGQVAAAVIRRQGLRFASVLGPALIALGCLLMVQITPVEGVVWVAVGYMIVGVGIVCMTVSTMSAATAGLGPAFQGLAAGLFNTSQNVGGAIGTSLASVVVTSVTLSAGGSVSVAATVGDRAALYLALGLTVLAVILALAIRTKAVAGVAGSKSGGEPLSDRRPEKSSI
jgi:MFS family permease